MDFKHSLDLLQTLRHANLSSSSIDTVIKSLPVKEKRSIAILNTSTSPVFSIENLNHYESYVSEKADDNQGWPNSPETPIPIGKIYTN
jgi:hypothetical protein